MSIGNTPGLDVLFERFCDDDLFGVVNRTVQPVSPENKHALQILETTTQFVGDRYESGLLWRSDSPRLKKNNRSMAERRHQSIERRFKINPSLAEKYSAAINEYIKLGHARKLSSEESINGPTGRTWWLLHHPVFNVKKPGKLRVVFDAAATFQGVSLNTELVKGPDLLTSLVGVLLRFRQYSVAVSADIVKMFHQGCVKLMGRLSAFCGVSQVH